MDRPTLLVNDGTLSRTPATQPLSRAARLQIEVAPDGSASFADQVEDARWSTGPERANLLHATADARLRATGLRGVATLSANDLNASNGPLTTTINGTLDNVVWPTGTTALPALTSLSGGIATQVESLLAERVRTQPFMYTGGAFDEVAQVELPKTVQVTYVPTDACFTNAFFDYSSRHVFDPARNLIKAERHLKANFGKQVCTPADFTAMQLVLKRIERDTDAQIIVKAAEP